MSVLEPVLMLTTGSPIVTLLLSHWIISPQNWGFPAIKHACWTITFSPASNSHARCFCFFLRLLGLRNAHKVERRNPHSNWGIPLLSKQQNIAVCVFNFTKTFLNLHIWDHSPLSLILKYKTTRSKQDVNWTVRPSKHISNSCALSDRDT